MTSSYESVRIAASVKWLASNCGEPMTKGDVTAHGPGAEVLLERRGSIRIVT